MQTQIESSGKSVQISPLQLSGRLAILLCCISWAFPSSTIADTLKSGDRFRILETPRVVTNFELTDHRGEKFVSAQLLGQVTFVFFGFTNCPDICPATMARLQQLYTSGEIPVDDVSVVLISVDGDRDSPQAMAGYLSRFSDDFIGLTGPPDMVSQLARRFRASFFKGAVDPATGSYSVGHSQQVFLLDRAVKLRAELYSPSTSAMVELTNALLTESE